MQTNMAASTARAELEGALRRDPGDEQAWTVFGDLLSAAGDRRGELIALEQRALASARDFERKVLRHRIEELTRAEYASWLGPLAQSGDLDPGLVRGFAMDPQLRRHHPKTLEKLLAIESRTGALLRTLTAERATGCTKIAALLRERGLGDLHSLSLPDPAFERVAPLAKLDGLRRLELARAAPVDLASLGQLDQLDTLVLPSLRADLEPFADHGAFAALRRLDLSFHASPRLALGRASGRGARGDEHALAPLAGREQLLELDLGHAGWTELAPLAELRSLERLVLASTDVFDLRPIMSLTALRELDLRGARALADLSPLTGHAALESLRLAYTRVRDLRPLRVLPRLKMLDIEATPVASIDDLMAMPALERVIISGSAITNIDPLLERGVQVIGRPPVVTPSWRELANSLIRGDG